jgi:hypothetical protein
VRCENARKELERFVDRHFCSDYGYSPELEVIHKECQQQGCISDMFQEKDAQTLRDCRSESRRMELNGHVMECKCCAEKGLSGEKANLSTVTLTNMAMESMKNSRCAELVGVEFPLSRERSDLMTYRYPIDGATQGSGFLFDSEFRHLVATRRMNEHDWKHRTSCFKYGKECRFPFPRPAIEKTTFQEDNDDETKATVWRSLEKGDTTIYPYTVESKRSLGSQFLNTHCKYITKTLGCNSNIQIGSPRCVFYVVHYSTKSTQKEDRGVDFDRVGKQVIRRIQKEEEKLVADGFQHTPNTEQDACFREGLCRFLIGMSVHLSQDVVSATMAHLLLCENGSRFSFSHDFQDLLVGQMLNKLQGEAPGDFVLRRRNRGENGEVVMWADYSVNDYLFRPECLEDLSFYEFALKFERIPFSFNRMNNRDESGMPVLQDDELAFKEDHPGRRYCYLRASKKTRIPKLDALR